MDSTSRPMAEGVAVRLVDLHSTSRFIIGSEMEGLLSAIFEPRPALRCPAAVFACSRTIGEGANTRLRWRLGAGTLTRDSDEVPYV
jgi:hypothetical protein